MKIIYIEATAEELEVRPTLASAIHDLLGTIKYSLAPAYRSVPEKEEEEEEDAGT